MKKALAILITVLSANASAQLEKSPTEMYSMRHNMMTTKTIVTILSVDNVKESCEKESRRRGFGGFGRPMSACSFWNPKECTIIVGPSTNNDILGHELRHCFQGNFHD